MPETYPKFKAAAIQAAPVWLDREATTEKACTLIREAASQGARLIAFPEVFIPAYPYWVWIDNPLAGSEYFKRLYKESVKVPGPETERLCEVARETGANVVMGINEVDPVRFGTIYNTNLFIDSRGRLLGKHRKLVATFAEKLIWGRGDGSTLRVYETEVGRLGCLNCAENTNTLARFALLAQGEQVHIANYPAFPFTRGYDVEGIRTSLARAHAIEGKVFVLLCSSCLTGEVIDELADSEEKRRLLSNPHNAITTIFGPMGRPLSEPLVDEEGIVYAEIDLEEAIPLKLMHDITGHYNRFDVLSLSLNRSENLPLREGGAAEGGPLREELQALGRELLGRFKPQVAASLSSILQGILPGGEGREKGK